MIKVLHVVTRIDVGGISTLIYNYYKYFDKANFRFDVVSIDTGRKQGYHTKFEDLGINVLYMPDNFLNRATYFYSLLKNNNYNIVHSHIEVQSSIYLLIARLAGVKVCIAHAHMSLNHVGFKNAIMKYLLKKVITLGFGASELSLNSVFGQGESGNYRVLNNAVDLHEFSFNKSIRDSYRKELQLTDKLVLGFVGRLTFEKNLEYLVKIFSEVQKEVENSVLLVVGDGERSQVLLDELDKSALSNKILWLKSREDVNLLMNAMDVLLLPSFSEGLPLVLVESQASSLQAIASDRVTQMVNLTPYIHYLPIDDSAIKMWSQLILKLSNTYERLDNSQSLTDKKFNVMIEAQSLANIYKSLLN